MFWDDMIMKHGFYRRKGNRKAKPSAEVVAYSSMRNRCLNENQDRFKDYGERGITICDRWLNGDGERTGLECFIEDMGPKPSPSHSLDRIENDLGYSPENCRWATTKEQARNTRWNRIVTICGEEMPLCEAVEKYSSVKYQTVVVRLYRGWSEERAILSPVSGKKSEERGI